MEGIFIVTVILSSPSSHLTRHGSRSAVNVYILFSAWGHVIVALLWFSEFIAYLKCLISRILLCKLFENVMIMVSYYW